MKLTNEVARNTAAPGRGSAMIWDTGHETAVRGFGVRINAASKLTPKGARSWFFSYRIAGSDKRVTIGDVGIMAAGEARSRAADLRRRVMAGEDPAAKRREEREAPTMEDLVARYLRDHLKLDPTDTSDPRKNDTRRMVEEAAELMGVKRKVRDVHFGDVESMHRKITESGRAVRANRVLAIVSKAFSLSLQKLPGEDNAWRKASDGNPCKGVKRNHEEGRERYFSTSELAKISEALNAYPGVAADCIRLVLLTGARPKEAMLARWEEFDTLPGSWQKPSSHTKQRKVHVSPLSAPALELIERLRKMRCSGDDWVFPGDKPGRPIAALWHCWHHVREHAGLDENSHIYSLRHSYASIAAGGGLSLPIIGSLLGHASPKSTARYVHRYDSYRS